MRKSYWVRLAEDSAEGVDGAGLGQGHNVVVHGQCGRDELTNDAVNLNQLVHREGLAEAEVEAQLVLRDQGAALFHRALQGVAEDLEVFGDVERTHTG